jgi:hypothetical protein
MAGPARQACQRPAQCCAEPVVAQHLVCWAAGRLRWLGPDGLHLNGDGHAVNGLRASIKRSGEAQSPEVPGSWSDLALACLIHVGM